MEGNSSLGEDRSGWATLRLRRFPVNPRNWCKSMLRRESWLLAGKPDAANQVLKSWVGT